MDPALPKPNYLRDREWWWPFAKFPLNPNDLFTTLHDRFNTRPFPLQDPTAFHRDVYECADSSDTVDEFYSQLEQRKAQRIEEMSEGWDEVSTLLVSFPTLLSCQLCYDPETHDVKMKPGTKNDSMAQRQFAFFQYAQCMSFDNLVTFFDGFVRDQREEQEKLRRLADEGVERFRRAQAAKRAATASETIEATSSSSPRRNSRRITRNKLKSSRNSLISISQSPAASAVATDTLQPASSSRRIGPLQADRLSPEQTAESSRTGKKRSNENAPRSTRKRQRITREDIDAEDVDSGGPSGGQDRSGAGEDSPTPTRRRKRKSTGDLPGVSRTKRARLIDSSTKRLRQSPTRSANQSQPGRAPSSTGRDSSIPSTAVPSNYDADALEGERIRKTPLLEPSKAFYIEEPTQSPSDGNPSAAGTVDHSRSLLSEINDMTQLPIQDDGGQLFYIQTADQTTDPNRAFYIGEPSQSPLGRNSGAIDANQEIPQADEDGTARELTTAVADTKTPKRKPQKKSRASNRQRVDKRRSTKEQDPSTPKKESRRRKPRERNPPPSAQRLLRSTRSSRRETGQEL